MHYDTTYILTIHGIHSFFRASMIMYNVFLSLVCSALLAFILEDLRSHFDLAVAWMYAEYAIAEGYLNSAQNNLQYDSCLTGLLNGTREKLDARDR